MMSKKDKIVLTIIENDCEGCKIAKADARKAANDGTLKEKNVEIRFVKKGSKVANEIYDKARKRLLKDPEYGPILASDPSFVDRLAPVIHIQTGRKDHISVGAGPGTIVSEDIATGERLRKSFLDKLLG